MGTNGDGALRGLFGGTLYYLDATFELSCIEATLGLCTKLAMTASSKESQAVLTQHPSRAFNQLYFRSHAGPTYGRKGKARRHSLIADMGRFALQFRCLLVVQMLIHGNLLENPLPPTLLATLITAQHMRPFQPLPMIFPPILLFSSYLNINSYKIDAAGITMAWSGLYLLLASRRKQVSIQYVRELPCYGITLRPLGQPHLISTSVNLFLIVTEVSTEIWCSRNNTWRNLGSLRY